MSDDIQLNDMCVTPDGPCETDDGPPEADSSTPRDTQGETLSGGSQHAANADAQWLAITSAPDFCRVGNSVVGFDSTATLDSPVRYSPDVIAAGRKLYRVGDLICGVRGDAGSGIVSGTSLGSGHVLITDGQDNVKVNGLPMARHDSACLINCNASGVGGAPGYLTTLRQTVQSAPGQAGAASDSEPSWNAGQEAGRVISDKWESAKSAARTAWEALPFSGDAATTAAARERVVQGAVDTYRGLDTLTGPSPLDLLDSGIGLVTGDAERAARYGEEWQRTADAYGGIKDAVVDAWQEARERNGTLGAIEMSATVFAFELVGPKGTGAAKSAADLAEAAGDVGRHAPKRPSDVATDDGVHISSNADINPDKKINGRKIINSEPPEKTVETAGGIVQFDKDGFPDFTPYSQKTVRVEGLNGSMVNDVPLAMERAGITSYNKSKYVWHHHQDGKTMMLVPKSVHSVRNGGVAHTGGRAVIQHNANNPDSLLTYPSPDEVF